MHSGPTKPRTCPVARSRRWPAGLLEADGSREAPPSSLAQRLPWTSSVLSAPTAPSPPLTSCPAGWASSVPWASVYPSVRLRQEYLLAEFGGAQPRAPVASVRAWDTAFAPKKQQGFITHRKTENSPTWRSPGVLSLRRSSAGPGLIYSLLWVYCAGCWVRGRGGSR